MVKVYAYINHGEWKVDCPKCGKARYTTLAENKYICRCCNPGIMAYAYQMVRTETNGIVQEIMRPVPDLALRQTFTVQARQAGEEYNIEFPQHAQEIADSINAEADVNWQNWYPNQPEIRAKHSSASAFGQSLADIQNERIKHPGHEVKGQAYHGIR